MSSSSQTLDHFKSILDAALGEYKSKTGNDLTENSLAKELQGCESAEAILDIIQREAKAFDKFKDGDKRLMKFIGPSVDVLYTISATLGQGVGMMFPAANVVSAGIGVLLVAAKDVKASHDVLVDLFERVQFFLKRLGVHTRITLTKDMVEILVTIMVEVLSILAIATKEVQQSRTKTYLKKLVGRTDIEDALKRLDDLTREEVQMAIAQILKATKELKDDAMRSNDAVKQMANTVEGMKDDMDEMQDDMDEMKGDVGEIKDNLYEIMDDVDEIMDDMVEIKWNQIELDVRKWVSPPDPSVNYNIACEAYQKGTAAWFIQGSIFKEWELIDSLLWIHGKPGSGKSILSSAIIKHVMSLRDAGQASLAYFFFDFRDKEKQTVRNFLTSLLIQLSAHLDPCRKIMSRIYWAHGKGTSQPRVDVLTHCLHKMLFIATHRPIYVIIDAIDECPNISGLPTPRAVLLDLLEELVELRIPNLHICITSRPDIDIKIVLEPLAYSTISLHDESGQQKDISDYVRKTVYSNRKMRQWRDKDRKLVVKVLSEKADGMFRWVFCQLAVLQHCLASSIRQTLDELPRTLDETYARVLSQIPHGSQDHAHRMLQCLMVALRPLRVEELAELLAFEFKAQGAVPQYRTDWRPNDQVEAVLSTCSSLISIVDDRDSQIVQFSHFSVKEFLMSNRLISSLGDFSQYQILPRPAHTILAQACLGFLLHLDGHVDKDIVKYFPLAEYAAKHWVTHAQFEDVVSRVKDGMETLFDCDQPHFAAWVGIYNMDEASTSESPPKIPTPLYYSSLCGFSNLVEHLAIKNPQHINAIGGKYKFPLLAALVRKHIRVAEILLEHGANVDIRGLRERTPLHEAIANVGIVQSLLNNGADVNCRQDDLRTPLHLAAYYGELKVARVLVEHKADVDSQDNEGKTPLHLLLEDTGRDDNNSILDLAQLLLVHCTDTNIRTTNGWTLLHAAAFWGRLEVVRVLLDHGTNPNAENKQGETPLHLVSQGKYNSEEHGVGIVRLLLERVVDVNARKKNMFTPLHSAALSGRLEIAQLLLAQGADTHVENEWGETALHVVSRGNYGSEEHGFGIARLLLEHGVDVNARQNDGWTSLHWVAFKGRVKVARVLLDHGANAKLETEGGETALHIVSRGEFDSQEQGAGTARLLLEHGVDVNAREKDGWTSLHWVAFKGRVKVARVLLDHGANTKLETEGGETALHIVSQGEFDSQEQGAGTARLLLEHGVDVNAREKDGWTSLHWVAFKGMVEVARVLLDHGANAKLETEGGETALHIVSRGEFDSQEQGVGTARLLLEHGVDVNARQNKGWTPLHRAAFKGRVEVAQALLNHGANAKLETKGGETALHIMSRGEFDSEEQGVGTARLLLEHGVDVNAREKDGWTSLHWAAFKGRVEVTRVLLDHGANAKLETEGGETALHTVSRGEYNSQEQGAGTARLLLERGVAVNAQQKNGWTSLHWAAFKGRIEVAQVLLDHGANAKLETEGGETALHTMSQGEHNSQEQGAGTAQLLLECGVDVDAWEKDGWTSLHWAAFKGRVEVTRVLLDHGASVKLETEGGETALHMVSRGEYNSQEQGAGTARMLLERGVGVNSREKDGWTSLHWAASKGRVEVAQVLLDHGANAKLETKRGETALHIVSRGEYASEEHGVGIARLLLDRGVSVHAQDKDQDTALHSAAVSGRPQLTRLLLDRGADPNEENEQGWTPLHQVSQGKYKSQEHGVGIARLLLERGVNVDARGKAKATPLHRAAFYGKLEIVQVLLDHGANPNAENDEGETTLHLVSQSDYDSQEHGVGIARLFLQRGVYIHVQDKDHDTPLHSAAFSGMLEITRLLLDHGADVNAENKHGRTPLHQVAQGKYDSQEHGVGVARLLVERGVDVHAQDKDHDTALHFAAFSGRLEIAKSLIDHGANTAAENGHGETPLHLASRGQYVSQENGIGIVQLLLEHGVDVDARDRHQNTSLHSASSLGKLEIARVLLDHGVKPGSENDRAQTPLHLVSQGGYWFQDDGVGVAKLLLERGADMHAQDEYYATPLHLACYRGRLDIARVLLEYDVKPQAENDTDVVPSAGQSIDINAQNEGQ